MDYRRGRRVLRALLAFLAGLELTSPAIGIAGETRTVDFNGMKVEAPPSGFTVTSSGGGAPAEWKVELDPGAPSPPNVLVQTSKDTTGQRFPLCVFDDTIARDVEVAIKFKPMSGEVDRAAGIVWRYRDRDNYYVVRANALESNVVLYKVQNGKRSDLKPVGAGLLTYGQKTAVPSDRWSSLRIVAKGSRFSVFFDDKPLFDVEDGTFADAGKVGLWTKADSVTAFDDFTVKTLDEASP
jgi:hypothetical protein